MAHVTDLVRVMTLLIENCLQHAFVDGENMPPRLITIIVAHEPTGITITFSDNGVGMDTEVTDHIFEPFFTTTRGQLKSSGLGLYICYNIVINQFHGTIRCVSRRKQGSQFFITIPQSLTATSQRTSE